MGNWPRLLDADQMSIEMRTKAIFEGFLEAAIDFPPTYRFNRGSRTYSSEKMRTPSYCDRVLYRSQPGAGDRLRQLSYTHHPSILTSDHTPVSATFELSLIDFPAFGRHPTLYSFRLTNLRALLHTEAAVTLVLTGDWLEEDIVIKSTFGKTRTPAWYFSLTTGTTVSCRTWSRTHRTASTC